MTALLFSVALFVPSKKGGTGEPLPLAFGKEGYQFTIEESGSGSGVTGKFQQGQPVSFRADGIEFFRQGDVLVYRTRANGSVPAPAPFRSAPHPWPVGQIRSARVPHEELAQLDKVWTNMKSKKEKGLVTLSGGLDKRPPSFSARSENRNFAVRQGRRLARCQGAGREIIKFSYASRADWAGRVDGEISKTVAISDVGSTQASGECLRRRRRYWSRLYRTRPVTGS